MTDARISEESEDDYRRRSRLRSNIISTGLSEEEKFMTVKSREYHRSFLHYPRRNRQPLTPDMFRDFRIRVPPPTTSVPQTSMGVPSGTQNNTRKVHKALEIVGSELREIFIEEKSDQKFEQFATPWEKSWSPLARRGYSDLLPVVDGNASVIGYSGQISGKDMLISQATGIPSGLLWTSEETLKFHRLFVGSLTLHSVAKLSTFNEWRYYAVITDIYGEVTAFEFASTSGNGETHSMEFPVLGWLKLLQTGLRLTVTLGKNGLRTLTRKPPITPPTDPTYWQKKFDDYAKLNKQRRISVGSLHPRVKGVPEVNIKVLADKEREVYSANRFAGRAEWDDVHLGDEARKFYNAPSGKFPDVVARRNTSLAGKPNQNKTLEFALSEGKGTDMNKVLQQFEAAKLKIEAAEKARAGGKSVNVRITEQEVVVERLVPTPVQGGNLMSPGPGFGVDKDGFLLDAREFVDLKVAMPKRAMVNGKPIRVVTMEYVGGPLHVTK